MRFDEFDRLIKRLVRDVPPEYLDGVAAIDVSPRTVPHAVRADVYTLGMCIPMHGDLDEVVSRIVLYHGSFRALAHLDDAFSWRDEAWDTLTHELRHHIEWRANADALEDYDWAVEQNFARQEGRPFDPSFYLATRATVPGVYQVEDDTFLDLVVRRVPRRHQMIWHGRRYALDLPDVPLPLFLTLDGLADPPPGDVIAVVRRRPGLRDLLRRPAGPSAARVTVHPVDGDGA